MPRASRAFTGHQTLGSVLYLHWREKLGKPWGCTGLTHGFHLVGSVFKN